MDAPVEGSAAEPGHHRHRDHIMTTNNDTQAMLDAIKANLTPHAVALLAAKLRPGRPSLQPIQATAPTDTAAEAEAQVAWSADQLREMLGTEQHRALCQELGIG